MGTELSNNEIAIELGLSPKELDFLVKCYYQEGMLNTIKTIEKIRNRELKKSETELLIKRIKKPVS